MTIPDSMTSIGSRAFYGCENLISVTIPDSVTSIGDMAFDGTPWLKNYPADLVIGGKILIKYKGNAQVVTIPDSVTSIGSRAFYGCENLISVTIPDSVTSIGEYAFYGCENLTSVTIPNSVTSIGDYVFNYCSSLTSIEVSKNNPNYASEDGVLFNKDKTELIQYPRGNTRIEYSIPDSVTSIGKNAFCGCSSLNSVTIPDSVTSIGYYVFLTLMNIPNSMMSFYRSAFENCKNLTSFTYHGATFSLSKTRGVSIENIIAMVEKHDFSVKMNHDVKYDAVWKIFLICQNDERPLAYIKKNFTKMFKYLIDNDDAETVQKVLDTGKFITKQNVDKFIQYAIDNRHIEIQVMLTNYKREKIGYSDPTEKLKLL